MSSKWLTKRAYKVSQLVVRTLSLLVLIVLCAFIFLRLYGVPNPLLSEVMKRANAAGIPVDIEKITLTLHGWRASNVSYYSRHPDDLKPVFHAQEVLFARRVGVDGDVALGWNFDIEASGISLHPSVEWGVEIPSESAARTIEKANLSLCFLPDRVELTDGILSWVGTRFHVSGTVLRPDRKRRNITPEKGAVSSIPIQKTVLPVYINEEQFRDWELRLKTIQFNEGLDVRVDFLVDTGNYSESRIDFEVDAKTISFKGIEFTEAAITGVYAYPGFELKQAVLYSENKSMQVAACYDFTSGEIEGEFSNGMLSKNLMQLLPQSVLQLLEKIDLSFDQLPRLVLNFGPSRVDNLLNTLSGTFSIRGTTYRLLEIDSLRGDISRTNHRLELLNLECAVIGQENRAEERDSCMIGGTASGEVFWDAASHAFGVSATGSMDPNLLLEPLSMVRIATNVISRFKFNDQPPEISLELGANYTDWKTFFINIQGAGKSLRIHDAELSSVNTDALYTNGVLRLNPLVAMQGTDFIKGEVSLDFIRSTASFDAFGSLQPQTVEDAIYPEFNVFGNAIKTAGDTQINARGILDWGSMRKTDFTAEVQAERVEIPVVGVDHFAAKVTGAGAIVSVQEATFGFYGGKGEADFSIRLDPEKTGMPYELEANVSRADFKKFIQFMNPGMDGNIGGELSGEIAFKADMALDFFETANGNGRVLVDDGQLADLPLFSGFSRLIRKVIPGFNVFSITSLQGTFRLYNGSVQSKDAYFEGDVISAKGQGSYSKQDGFDALIQAQIMKDNPVTKVIRVITDPIFKFFEIKLEGTLSAPTWKLEKFQTKPVLEKSAEDDSDSD